ncbi:MAG: S-layer homology domain-containing protein, partial [Clostridia bacterium]|nr:S-layer homology domain-containing protein [Clostridia bacterium]
KEKAPYSDTAQYIYVNIRGCHLPSVSVDMLHPDFFTLMYENSSRAIHPDEEGHAFIAEKMLERIRVPYYDVNKEDMSYDAVAYVTEKGLMDAYDTHEFSKNSIATRGMIATALYRMAGSPAVDSNIKFTDVSDGKYYTEAVEWAVENDVIDSINSKIFMPFGGMTRQKLITILWEMAGSPEIDADIDYLDSFLISKSSRTAMAWAVENGIIKGLEGKMISPLGIVTRAQLAMILQRYCEL